MKINVNEKMDKYLELDEDMRVTVISTVIGRLKRSQTAWKNKERTGNKTKN